MNGGPSPLSSSTWQLHLPRQARSDGVRWDGVVDLNGDGFRDLIVLGNTTSPMLVFWGRRDGLSMESVARLMSPVDDRASSVSNAADFDLDGICDIVVGRANTSSTMLVNGRRDNASLSATPLFTADGSGRAIFGGGDLDGDGQSDVAIVSETATAPFVQFATAYLSSSASVTSDRSRPLFGDLTTREIVTTSLDRDHLDDLVAIVRNSGTSRVEAYMGHGDFRNSAPPRVIEGIREPVWLRAVGDVDADGLPELWVSHNSGGTLYQGSGYRNLFSTSGPAVLSVCGADFDGDGFSDFGISRQDGLDVEIYAGAVPTLPLAPTTRLMPNSGGGLGGLVCADFNADGFGDLASMRTNGVIAVWYGSATGLSVNPTQRFSVMGTDLR
ncbi:MAG: VCBS repeat-containing protein [Myxococcales bacterium]|nr:VCBS repeat-containing protein [Myxococcales bacterium]